MNIEEERKKIISSLTAARLEKNLSQEALARLVGTKRSPMKTYAGKSWALNSERNCAVWLILPSEGILPSTFRKRAFRPLKSRSASA